MPKTTKLSDTMRDALRIMQKTGAVIVWDGFNEWSLNGRREFHVMDKRAPSCTVVDALERRGFVEKSWPEPDHKMTYNLTETGKAIAV